MTKICAQCGQEFNTARSSQKYCSIECRRKVKYAKDCAWLADHPGKAKEYSQAWYAKNRETVLAAKQIAYREKCAAAMKKSANEQA